MYKSLPAFLNTFFLLFIVAQIQACGGTESPNGETKSANAAVESAKPDTGLAPVETKSPNSELKPAFAGQTRIAGVQTKTAYESKMLTKKLESPWGIASLPDGRFLITQKKGSMVIVSNTGEVGESITGLPDVNSNGQGGLLGLTLDPAFAQNRMVYWVFSENVSGGSLTSVAKGKLSADEKKIENAVVIYRATPAYKNGMHYGGRILFDRAGNIWVSTGERSDPKTRPQAQQLNSGYGKVIRITKEGKPVDGNPFSGGERPEIYSYGHRNVQGLAIHPVSGDIWEGEFGPRGGDEINLIRPGKNYGWPIVTYGIEYGGSKVGDGISQKEGLEQPVYYWDPVISPSGMTFYNGNEIPEWKNNLFITCLSGEHIARLVINNNKVVGEERLLVKESQRFRDITQGTDGALYAVTDSGRLYRIGKK